MILTVEHSVVNNEFGDTRSNRPKIVSDRTYTDGHCTYKAPNRKIAHTPSFFPKGSCSSKIWTALESVINTVIANIL